MVVNLPARDALTPSVAPVGSGMVPAVELKVSSRSQGDHELVIATGEIDLYTAPRLQSELAAVIASAAPASRVIVDMSGVDFCDSTGMNVLLSCLRQARERGGELELAAPRPAVRKILSVTGLDAVFTVADLRLSSRGRCGASWAVPFGSLPAARSTLWGTPPHPDRPHVQKLRLAPSLLSLHDFRSRCHSR